jgi:hypothetical protein
MWKPMEIMSYAQITALLFETNPMTKDNQDLDSYTLTKKTQQHQCKEGRHSFRKGP